MLVALLRQHFQKKQEKHTHQGLLPPTLGSSKQPPLHGNSTHHEESSARLNVPALTRAKMAIASSFENLRSKPVTEKKQKSKPPSQQSDTHSQSLNLRSTSPLFARRTSIDTLMAPVSTSPMKQDDEVGKGRIRSWTAGVGEIWQRPRSKLESSSDLPSKQQEEGLKAEQEEDNTKQDSKKSVFKTPRRFTAPRPRRRDFYGSDEVRHLRHSLTPPASASVEKYLHTGHRRSTSNIVSSSWRQEIFDSVSTPTKLDGGFPRAFSKTASDICELRLPGYCMLYAVPPFHAVEEWQVIEIGTTGETWKDTVRDVKGSPRTRARTRWQNAIRQQILLNHMERENQQLKSEFICCVCRLSVMCLW